MKAGRSLFCAALVMSLVGSHTAIAAGTTDKFDGNTKDERAVREWIRSNVAMARINGWFDKIEALADEYRTKRSRTPSGVWKLSVLYRTINESVAVPYGYRYAKQNYERWLDHGVRWLRENPDSPTPIVVRAVELVTEAYRIRGNGPAHDVWPDAWKGFREKLEQAREVLEQNKLVGQKDPDWFRVRIDVARSLGEGFKKIGELVEAAVRKEPYYYQTYFSALLSLTPQWGGSVEQMDRFIAWSVAKTKEKDGRSMFARLHWTVYGFETVWHHHRYSKEFWPKMRPALVDLFERYPNIHNVLPHLGVACRSRNYDAAQWLLFERKRIGGVIFAKESDDPNVVCGWRQPGFPIREQAPIEAAR